MFKSKVKIRDRTKQVEDKAEKGTYRSLGHAGGSIRLWAIYSIKEAEGASPPGQPPHTHTKRLHRAIKYAVQKQRKSVVIGPDVESFGTAGKAHEHGGSYRGEHYPKRPFMLPALEAARERLPKFWAGSVR